MEGVSCLSDPLLLYDTLFTKHGKSAKSEFKSILIEYLDTQRDQVPVINHTPLDSIPEGHLVCVRGMIQDMFNTEFFVDEFRTTTEPDDRENGLQFRSLCFRDYATDQTQVQNDLNTTNFGQRQSFYVVPIPGESFWVHDAHAASCLYTSASLSSGTKRRVLDADNQATPKKSKLSGCGEVSGVPKNRKQFPLSEEEADENKHGVLLRVYDDLQDQLKLNEIIRVFGILEHTRLGSTPTDYEFESGAKGADPIPHVHAVYIERLQHNNPLSCLAIKTESKPLADDQSDKSPLSHVDIQTCQQLLSNDLCELVHGDRLVAEYILLHLVSSRYTVNSLYPTTLPALNIVCSPSLDEAVTTEKKPSTCLADRLRTYLPSVLTQLVTVDCSIDSLNTGPALMPIRDVSKGAMDVGRLQLPNGSQVLVDETHMTQGELGARGLLNFRALNLLATKQQVPYDFQFYTQEWETHCPVLIISSGPSLIKPVLALPWEGQPDFMVNIDVLNQENKNWHALRKFITTVIHTGESYLIDELLQQHVNDDFVNRRRSTETYIDADDLAIMLCLLRLVCLAHGETRATLAHWEQVCRLEEERRLRLKASIPQLVP